MNWYKKAQLDPDAWQFHDQTHRLQKDQPLVKSPYSNYMTVQKQRPAEELAKDYAGVHVSRDPQICMMYANSMATKENPPVILEIHTTKGWETDIDAEQSQNIYPLNDWLENLNYNIEDKIKLEGLNEDVIMEIMDDIENIEIDNYGDDGPSGASNILQEQGKNIHPSAIVDYFNNYYGADAPKYFYQKFILPIIYGEGELDKKITGWFINQMRFMSKIPQEEITAIYTFTLFSEEIYEEYNEEESEYDKQGRKKFTYDELLYNSPGLKEIWRNNQTNLIPETFDTYYHGTTRERAKQAFPQFAHILDKI